jgi:A/G-specific adenine glycosylase
MVCCARASRARGVKLRRQLLDWYRANRRDLPWRNVRDPYAIWISEAMLQQTRVETVIPYWERFLARFPDVAALAAAEPDDVLGHWAGLGYYSRARNLHAAAKLVAARHGGRLPDTAEGLRGLPGVGRYTAGAVASIAFDRPEPVVDGEPVHTNHYLAPELEALGPKPSEGSLARRARLQQLMQERRPQTVPEVMDILRDHGSSPQAICLHPDPEEGDEASAVMFSMVAELEEGRMWVASGNPCENEYEEVDLSGVL